MILQALNQYYKRLLDDPKAQVSEFGFGLQGVHFALTLDRSGALVGRPMDLREEKGRPRRIEVPGPVVKANGIKSNFAWDNTGYVLGADDKGKPERTAMTHAAFKTLAFEALNGVDDEGAAALLAFLEQWDPERAAELPGWEEMVGLNIVFMLDGEPGFLHDRPAFRRAWRDHLTAGNDEFETGQCLVTGEVAPIPPTNAKIKGVPGAQTAGASLVSFNIDAAKSYGKEQNLNSPISVRAAFAYTTALNCLLAPDSTRKVQVGETTMVFWAEAPSQAEVLFGYAMGAKKSEDNSLVQRMERYLGDVAQGKYPEEFGEARTPFYVLGLSPNAARLSVRFWHVGTVGQMAENLGAHFRALSLQRRFDNEPEHPSPWQLLRELALQRDIRNLSPLLPGQFLRSIIQGRPYPQTLLSAAIGRIRADREITYLRTAILKAFLLRSNANEEITMHLNEENRETGYLLGRLFATLERTQNAALGNVNASVRDKYFASAAATPGLVFPIIISNAQNWLSKIAKDKEKGGLAHYYDRIMMKIIGNMDDTAGYPKTLSLREQGLFTIGYYQQMQDFYTKKEKDTEE
ncbi:type I-C CRISPR-associated protein Cas8c/Csd1 [Pseudodesulfovibrio thermohalotolerans]|uniref:type I-C CRISPR-associated protein Cas8c/Csd1 n=1 Tax=Pseudodesulfovibrio thermohalotolerans TaxID=2880651 RepID=UPI002442D8DE|nr:type I-C CRISPR-associated protein Cas8c/Csd1 [Pseudodesulfovibrio thermohalotolerans]WFS63346.1 type I-C CRISPR-associated protein Cas8c/Csd1 [Pseudodesulfovibrio thermohalotolerans]